MVTGVVPSPPRYVPSFLSRIGFSIPTARRFSSIVAHSRSRAFRYDQFSCKKTSLRVCALGENGTREIDFSTVGTRITYQATGDAGVHIYIHIASTTTRYQVHTRYTHACGVRVVLLEHGGGALGTYFQVASFLLRGPHVRFT